MRAAQFIQSFAAVALLAIPATAMAAPDQNSGPNQNQNQNQNNCGYTASNGQWVRTSCNGQKGQWNNGQNGRWNNGRNDQWNNGRNRNRDRDADDRRRDDDNNGRGYGYGNNGNGYGYGNGNNGYGNGNRNRNAQLTGSVSSFSPYNLYLSNGTHVELHNGTVINPTGANLTPGTRVRVSGNWNGDRTYSANEIDVVGNGSRGY